MNLLVVKQDLQYSGQQAHENEGARYKFPSSSREMQIVIIKGSRHPECVSYFAVCFYRQQIFLLQTNISENTHTKRRCFRIKPVCHSL